MLLCTDKVYKKDGSIMNMHLEKSSPGAYYFTLKNGDKSVIGRDELIQTLGYENKNDFQKHFGNYKYSIFTTDIVYKSTLAIDPVNIRENRFITTKFNTTNWEGELMNGELERIKSEILIIKTDLNMLMGIKSSLVDLKSKLIDEIMFQLDELKDELKEEVVTTLRGIKK